VGCDGIGELEKRRGAIDFVTLHLLEQAIDVAVLVTQQIQGIQNLRGLLGHVRARCTRDASRGSSGARRPALPHAGIERAWRANEPRRAAVP
jgi:hypothetical protein